MSFAMELIRRLLQPHPVIVMKDHAFEQGFDDLGQAEGDVERKVSPPPAPPVALPDDEIDAHLEHDRAAQGALALH